MKQLELIPLSSGTVEFARQLRNKHRKWFFHSEEISKQTHIAWYRKYIEDWWDVMFIIHLDGKPIGTIAIYNIDTSKRTAEVGRLIIDEPYQRQGYGTAAIKLILDYGRETLNVLDFYLSLKSDNWDAMNLYKKAGFVITEKEDRLHGKLYGKH